MKKSFVLLLTLVVLISGTVCFAQNELLNERDQVHFTEKALYGDKSVVDGVTVETDIFYNYHLYWNSQYEIGDAPKEKTKYTFYPWRYRDVYVPGPGHLSFIMWNQATLSVGLDNFEKDDYYGIELAMKELYESTTPGTTNMVTIALKDYMDYYSFGLDINVPGKECSHSYSMYSHFHYNELKEDLAYYEKTGNKEQAKELKKYLDDMETFQEFFKIPVLDTEKCILGMAKDENGVVIGMAESSVHGGSSTGQIEIPNAPVEEDMDSFSLNIHSIFDNGDCYFSFDPHTFNGDIVDVSQIPGGYGIYHFTYNEIGEMDLSNLKMVFPLDTKLRYEELLVDGSGNNLLLFTSDEEHYYLSIIDRASMKLVDSFTIGDSESYLDNWVYEDFFVVRSDKISVFSFGENGQYLQAFAVDLQKMKDTIGTVSQNAHFVNWDSYFDWNGTTLLIADDISYEDEYLHSIYTCNVYVAAVDETGLVYYGEYDSTLNLSALYEECRFVEEANPIRIYWDRYN